MIKIASAIITVHIHVNTVNSYLKSHFNTYNYRDIPLAFENKLPRLLDRTLPIRRASIITVHKCIHVQGSELYEPLYHARKLTPVTQGRPSRNRTEHINALNRVFQRRSLGNSSTNPVTIHSMEANCQQKYELLRLMIAFPFFKDRIFSSNICCIKSVSLIAEPISGF